jgi:carboxyl-terminal processing protease
MRKTLLLFFCVCLGFVELAFTSGEKGKNAGSNKVATVVGKLLEEGHYTRQKLDGPMSQRILDTYLESLDAHKLFFLQEDVNRFQKSYGTTFGKALLRGDLGPADAIYALFKQRFKDRVAAISELLKKEYHFESLRTVAMDRKDQPWPADGAEADALWKDRIEGELLREKLNRFSNKPPVTIVANRYKELLKEVDGNDQADINNFFFNAAAQSYDPHSLYLGRTELEQFQIEMRLSLSGIGAQIGVENGNPTIESLFPGGPAENSGKIHAGDTIAAVAQKDGHFVDTLNMKLDKVVEMILGKKGTTVRLQLIPANSKDTRTLVDLVRQNVKLTQKEARGEIVEKKGGNGGIIRLGVILLPSFYEDMSDSPTGASSSDDVAMLIRRMKKEKIQGLLVDLRGNPGGYLDEAIKISGLFLNDGPVVQVKDASGDISVLKTHNRKALYSGPLVVLENKLSASASEIFAAAMQDYGRAVVVGDSSTFGKGTVQTTVELGRFLSGIKRSSAGALNLTIQKFYRVAGGSTQLQGVRADVVIPSLTDNRKRGESAEQNPLPYDQIEPTRIDLEHNRKSLFLNVLRNQSAKRIGNDSQFNDLTLEVNRLGERLKRNRLSLNEEIRRNEMAEEEDLKAKETVDQKKAAANDPDRYEALPLSAVTQPSLQPLITAPKRAQKHDDTPDAFANDSSGDSSGDEDELDTPGDAAGRESLNILSDLVTRTERVE